MTIPVIVRGVRRFGNSVVGLAGLLGGVPVSAEQSDFLNRLDVPSSGHHLVGSDRDVLLEKEGGDIARLVASHSSLTHSGEYSADRFATMQLGVVSFLHDGAGTAQVRPVGASSWLQTVSGGSVQASYDASSVSAGSLGGCVLSDDDARFDALTLRELFAVRTNGGQSTRTGVCDLNQVVGGFDLYRFDVAVVNGGTASFDVGINASRDGFSVVHRSGSGVRLVPRVPGDPSELREDFGVSSGSLSFSLADLGAGCSSSSTVGCLHDGLFKVSGPWRLGGNSGQIHLVDDLDAPGSSLLTYWEDHSIGNKECIVKVLDGRSLNGYWWVFSGCATTVGFDARVENTLTGESVVVSNPAGVRSVAYVNTGAFRDASSAVSGEVYAGAVDGLSAGDVASLESLLSQGASKSASAPLTTAFLGPADRFELRGSWALGSNSGVVYFSQDQDAPGKTLLAFWSPQGVGNKEGIVKVLDGRGLNGCYWLLGGFASTVGYEITALDRLTGEVRVISNVAGSPAQSHADTEAFCDVSGAVAPIAGEKASAAPDVVGGLRDGLNALAGYVQASGESGDLLPMHSLVMPGFGLGSGLVNGAVVGAVRADISGGVIRAHDRALANVYCLPSSGGALQYVLFMDRVASSNAVNGASPLSVSLGGATVSRDQPFAVGTAVGGLATALRDVCYGSPVVLTPDERNKMSLAGELATGLFYNGGTYNNLHPVVVSPQGVDGQVTIEDLADGNAYFALTWRDHPTVPNALELLSQGAMAMPGQEVTTGLNGVPGNVAPLGVAGMYVSGNSQGGQTSPAGGVTNSHYTQTLLIPSVCLESPWNG